MKLGFIDKNQLTMGRQFCTARDVRPYLLGEAKHILSMVRLRLRSLTGARDEFVLTATVQNLKRLAQHSTIPPPQASAA